MVITTEASNGLNNQVVVYRPEAKNGETTNENITEVEDNYEDSQGLEIEVQMDNEIVRTPGAFNRLENQNVNEVVVNRSEARNSEPTNENYKDSQWLENENVSANRLELQNLSNLTGLSLSNISGISLLDFTPNSAEDLGQIYENVTGNDVNTLEEIVNSEGNETYDAATDARSQEYWNPSELRMNSQLTPGVLKTIAEGGLMENPKFQLLNYCWTQNGARVCLSDGKFKTWFASASPDALERLKKCCKDKPIIEVVKMEIHKGTIIHICDFLKSWKETNGQILQPEGVDLIMLETNFYTKIIQEMGMFVNGQWMKTHPDYLSESVLEPPAKKSRRPAVRRQLLDDVPPPSLPPSLPADRQIRADFPVDTELEQRAPLPSSSPAAISRTRSRRAHSREVAQTEGLLAAVMPAPSGGGIP